MAHFQEIINIFLYSCWENKLLIYNWKNISPKINNYANIKYLKILILIWRVKWYNQFNILGYIRKSQKKIIFKSIQGYPLPAGNNI